MPSMVMKSIYEKTFDTLGDEVTVGKKCSLFQKIVECYYKFQLKQLTKKFNYSKYLESNDDICDGAVVIKGTRIRPITILNFLCAYITSNEKKEFEFEEILEKVKESYPALDDKQVLVSLLYCLKDTNSNFKNLES